MSYPRDTSQDSQKQERISRKFVQWVEEEEIHGCTEAHCSANMTERNSAFLFSRLQYARPASVLDCLSPPSSSKT